MDHIIENWAKNRGELASLDEAQLKLLLANEKKERHRETVVVAIHQRLAKLRTSRERDLLIEKSRAHKEKLAARAEKDKAKAAKANGASK